MKAKYIKKEKIARDIYSFYFQPQKPVHYTAGQFTELYLPHENKDNRGIKRWFTLSSSPDEELLAITTNFTEPNGSSFKNTLKNLPLGTEVDLATPMGDFVLPKDDSIPLVFVAGGIGCTPFRSIVNELKISDQKRDIQLIYSARTIDKVAFKGLFETLGSNFKIILSEAGSRWKGEEGRLTAEKILELARITPEHYIYLSGPEPMVETLFKDLKNHDINKKHIFGDYFPNYETV